MKIAFYHELPAGQGVGLRDVFTGRVPCSGGMGRIWVAAKIAQLGAEVTVFHHLTGGPVEEIVEGVRSIRLGTKAELIEHARFLEKDDALVVNFYDGLPQLAERLSACQCRKIIWAGCNPPFEWCDLIDGLRFHRLICVSNESREYYRLHPHWARIGYIHSSLNTALAIPLPRVPLPGSVAFLGALREEKGFHHMLAAWPLVRAAEPEATLTVFGSIRLHFPDVPVGRSGVMTPEFEQKYLDPLVGSQGDWRRLGITFAYPQTKENLLARLAQTTIGVVNPNLRGSTETYCLSAVEMQACGCPCIGGGVGGLMETIQHAVSGYHLRTRKPQELAHRILQVLRHPGLRSRLSAGALAHSARLASTEREAQDWLEMIAKLNRGMSCSYEPKLVVDLARRLGVGRVKSFLKKVFLLTSQGS